MGLVGGKKCLGHQKSMLPLATWQLRRIPGQVMDEMERDLDLLGITAVEDKIQIGVPETAPCMQSMQRRWVLNHNYRVLGVCFGQFRKNGPYTGVTSDRKRLKRSLRATAVWQPKSLCFIGASLRHKKHWRVTSSHEPGPLPSSVHRTL